MSKNERKPLTTTSSSRPYNRLEAAKEWLTENYIVRVNLLDRSKVSLSPTPNCPFHYEHSITEDDIILHAYADELETPQSVLKLLLRNPNQMEAFNPVHDYLNALRGKYKGPSQIDLLCNSLRLTDDKDTKEEYQRAHWITRKWIVATVACALGIRQNDVALGLVGEKAGIGKTTVFEQMVPDCLRDYYQLALRGDRLFSLESGFAQRFILNFDEFAAITKSNEQDFKQMMSSKEIKMARKGSKYTETVKRVASCCFTSNKNHRMGGFIRIPDPGLMRRLAVIEVDGIDDYRKQFDVDQLWAEAVMLLDGGFDPEWTQQEYQDFVKYNREYVLESNALRLVRLYYREPKAGEECKFRTAMMIVQELKQKRKVSSAQQEINEVSVGMALSVLGYKSYPKRVDGQPRHGYDIIPMFDDT